MPFFRKKPAVIEAMQYTPESSLEVREWIGNRTYVMYDAGIFEIATDSGMAAVCFGDWIIKGIQGEFYPCKPRIFEATYDAMIKAAP